MAQINPHPLDEYVWSEPDRLGGELCFRNTRVPVSALFDYLGDGETLDSFLSDFEGVTREQAEGVIELAKRGIVDPPHAA